MRPEHHHQIQQFFRTTAIAGDVFSSVHKSTVPKDDTMQDTRHLAELLSDYNEVLALIETSGFPIEQIRILDGEQMLLHDRIIEEVKRLGYTVNSREDALWITRQIV